MKRYTRYTRIYRSAFRKPPHVRDWASRRLPIVDTWNAQNGLTGMARVDWHYPDDPWGWCFNVIDSCGLITHWRWVDEEALLQDIHDTMPERTYR